MTDIHRQSWAEILAEPDAALGREVLDAPRQQETLTPEQVKARMEAMGYQCVYVDVRGDMYHILAIDDMDEPEIKIVHKSKAGDYLANIIDLTKLPEKGLTAEDWAQVPCIYSWHVGG